MRRIRYNARIAKRDYQLTDPEYNKAIDRVAIQAISDEILKKGLISVFKEEVSTMKGPVIEIDAECYIISKDEFEKLKTHITNQDIKAIMEILKSH